MNTTETKSTEQLLERWHVLTQTLAESQDETELDSARTERGEVTALLMEREAWETTNWEGWK
jgi:hypothetical protein